MFCIRQLERNLGLRLKRDYLAQTFLLDKPNEKSVGTFKFTSCY